MISGVRTVIWITLFGSAMGCLEAIVVVYLRELYYPAGFDFPMTEFPLRIAAIELSREISTLVMLAVIGIIAGNNLQTRFAYFLYAFAIWDILYYVFLKIFLNWPPSFFTWDILFLIPVIWTGPVFAPLITACTMILLALLIIFNRFRAEKFACTAIIGGAVIVFVSMSWDFARHMLSGHAFAEMFILRLSQHALSTYVPVAFPWWVFMSGEALILMGIFSSGIKLKTE